MTKLASLLLLAGTTPVGVALLQGPAFAQTGPIDYNFRGTDGTCCSSGVYSNNGHNGSPGQRDFLQTDQNLNVRATAPGQVGVTVDVSGGHGGNGHGTTEPDPYTNDSHWGGNGSFGRIIDYVIQNGTIASQGRGLNITSAGGNGGRWGNAGGPNGGYGIGGDGHLARVTFHNATVAGVGFGIAAQSWGGSGADSAYADGFGAERDAGSGGRGGDATVNLQGNTSVTVRGPGPDDVSAGVGLLSEGGNGGTGHRTGDFGGHSNAGRGGAAGNVSFTSERGTSIAATGDGVHGVIARSIGGNASTVNTANVHAEVGGSAGAVTIANGGTITTVGTRSIGILALSQGGQGGNGGDGSWGHGNRGAPGGSPGAVNITNSGTITTGTADTVGAHGIVAQVLGGQGGPGGDGGSFGGGANGGSGGAAGLALTIDNQGAIQTRGNDAAGVVAHAVGGGGGQGGAANGIMVVGGGNGGYGGNGGDIKLTSSGSIGTTGDHSAGAVIQSIGGGGGTGGDANSTGVIVSIAIGGQGGVAGNAGNIVDSSSSGSIVTTGASSAGVLLQSIGGGGGQGGSADAVGVGVGLNVTLSTGGSGGAGGSGGIIQFSNRKGASISTDGPFSAGILAQAIGGGGGDGGLARSRSITIAPPTGDNPTGTVSIAITNGGHGGSGNHGGIPDISNAGRITTADAMSNGITAQSIGGGGGNGGGVLAPMKPPTIGPSNIDVSVTVRHGGTGGAGGAGNWVRVLNDATGVINTSGNGALGILAQSVGGGGGNGGNVQQHDANSFNDIVGSPSAFVGAARTVTEWLEKGGLEAEFSKSLTVGVSVTTGGSGGAGGNGDYFVVSNAGGIATDGAHAPGILAQSIGGGGGNAGTIDSSSVSSLLSSIEQLAKAISSGVAELPSFAIPAINVTVQNGGNGGAGGSGGGTAAQPSIVTNTGTITTTGVASAGIIAQSIGGGGGVTSTGEQSVEDAIHKSGEEHAVETIELLTKIVEALGTKGGSLLSNALSSKVGGQNGLPGDGGVVVVDASARTSVIGTKGAHSPGIIAQSIGGGGGLSADSYALLFPNHNGVEMELGGSATYRVLPALLIASDSGHQVSVRNGGKIETSGVNSAGILAQSIGGGGGASVFSLAGGSILATPRSAQHEISLGGKFDAAGGIGIIGQPNLGLTMVGGAVTVSNTGSIGTLGALSHGIIAQSIAGGGGVAILSARTAATATATSITLGAQHEPDLPITSSVFANGGTVAVGGDPNVVSPGVITTRGHQAFGILAQSIGGGGGYVAYDNGTDVAGVKTTLTFGINATQKGGGGANGSVVGTGGAVNVTQNPGGKIETSGTNAHAIVAQSVGGGGGIAALALVPGLATLASVATPSLATTAQSNAGGAVAVTSFGEITTHGNGAIGVLAQSVGGGGGIAGDASSARYGLDLIKDAGLTSGNGNGGAVNVSTGGGSITTYGANAPAILAMSLGGGAVFMDSKIYQYDTIDQHQSFGGAVTVDIGAGSKVAALGANSPAIVAVSNGSYGGSGGVWVKVGTNASVTANADSGIGVLAPMGVTVDNDGLISAKTAISAAQGVVVNNRGTIQGDIALTGSSTFHNAAGGTLWTGANFQATTLDNAGTLNPGGPGVFLETRITGVLQQTSGTYAPDLDFAAHKSDFLRISGASTFGGSVAPVPHNPVKGVWLGIGHFDVAPAAGVTPTIVNSGLLYSYTMKNNGQGTQDPLISIDANFQPRGVPLNKDQAATAAHLQSLWDTANVKSGVFFGTFTGILDASSYVQALGAAASDASLARTSARSHESYAFLNRLMSCPYFIDGGTRLSEGECVWGRVTGTRTDRSSTSEDAGYRSQQVTYQIGAQKEIAPDWFLGGSLGYARTNEISTGRAVNASSDSIQAGLTLKRQIGPWQFAGALLGGYESSTGRRDILLPGFFARADSRPDAYFLAARGRVSYELPFGAWYVKPFADLDVTYDQASAYRETGAGLFDLAYRSTSRVALAATPSIEVGGRIDLEGATLRPYLAAGVSFVSNGDAKARLSLAEFPAAPFQIATELPKVYGNLTAGLELVTRKGWELKAEYSLRGAKDILTQSAALRMAMRF